MQFAWAREAVKFEKGAGGFQGKRKAHSYFKKIRLTSLQKSQVLTGALGNYTVDALSKAALHTFGDRRIPRKTGSTFLFQKDETDFFAEVPGAYKRSG